MKILIIAPWFRTLARLHAEALTDLGHECMVVTSDAHFEESEPGAHEFLLPLRIKDPRWIRRWVKLRGMIARFDPDFTLIDESWDFRFTALAGRARTAVVVHDAKAHDEAQTLTGWRARSASLLRKRGRTFLCFSEHVASQLRPSTHVQVLPLTSEMPDTLVRNPTGPRRDFLVMGRILPYKNLPNLFEAWSTHVAGPAYCGDTLVVVGSGQLDGPLPAGVAWREGVFRFSDLAEILPQFKASFCVYRAASQSGSALMSMQSGVEVVVSCVGGLAEYQPPGRSCIDPDDTIAMAAAFDRLADPDLAAALGREAQEWYAEHFSAQRVGLALERALRMLPQRVPGQL